MAGIIVGVNIKGNIVIIHGTAQIILAEPRHSPVQIEAGFLGRLHYGTIVCLFRIGKGAMKENTEAGCKEFGAIHCVFPAGSAVVAANCVEEIESADWLDLGMPEGVFKCRVREFGPLFVTIDTEGRNFFKEKKVEYEKIKDEEVEKISAKVGYIL